MLVREPGPRAIGEINAHPVHAKEPVFAGRLIEQAGQIDGIQIVSVREKVKEYQSAVSLNS